MRNFLARPTKKQTKLSTSFQNETPPKQKKYQQINKNQKYSPSKQKIVDRCNSQAVVCEQFPKIQEVGEISEALDRSQLTESVLTQYPQLASEIYETPIAIQIILIGNANQQKFNDKYVAVKKSNQLQNCRKTLKQLFMRLFIEQGNSNSNRSRNDSNTQIQKPQKENKNKEIQNNNKQQKKQLSISEIIDHVSLVYENTLENNEQIIVPKQFKYCNFILKFEINLHLPIQQLQKNQYSPYIDTWRQIQIPKILILMYHASKKQDYLLLSRFILDVQHFYKKKKQQFDFNFIKKIKQKKYCQDKICHQLVTGIIAVDRSIAITNYKNIADWVSVEQGIELAKKFNLLYMEIPTNQSEQKNDSMMILTAASLLKLNEFGLSQQVRNQLQLLQNHLQKYEQSSHHKQYKLLQKLIKKFSKMLLTLLNKIQLVNIKIEQLLLAQKQIQQYIYYNSYLIKYNIKNEIKKYKLLILDNIKTILKKQQQNMISKYNHIKIIIKLFNNISSGKYNTPIENCYGINSNLINQHTFFKKQHQYQSKIHAIIITFTQNIILEFICNKQQWFKQNLKGHLKQYIQHLPTRKLANIDPKINQQQNKLNVIVDQLIEMIKQKSTQMQIQNTIKKNIYNKFKQRIISINKILQNELNTQNISLQVLKQNNFNNQNIKQLLQDTIKLTINQNTTNNPTIKQLMNISEYIQQSINLLLESLNLAYKQTKQYHNVLKQQILAKIQWKFNLKLCMFHKINQIYQYTIAILQQIKKYHTISNQKLPQQNQPNKKIPNECNNNNIDKDDQLLNQYLIQYYLTKSHEELRYKNELLLKKYSSKASQKQKQQQQIDWFFNEYQIVNKKNSNQDIQIIQNLSTMYNSYLQKMVKILASIHKQKNHQQLIKYQYLNHFNNVLGITKETRKQQLLKAVSEYKKKSDKSRQKKQKGGGLFTIFEKRKESNKEQIRNKTKDNNSIIRSSMVKKQGWQNQSKIIYNIFEKNKNCGEEWEDQIFGNKCFRHSISQLF